MSDKSVILLTTGVGSLLGGFLPSLWGAGVFSLWGVLFETVGGIAGIWVGWRLTHS